MADWRGSVVVRERDWHTKGPGFESGLSMSYFLVEKLSIIVQKFSKCLKNGNDRLRKGKLQWRPREMRLFSQAREIQWGVKYL